MRGPDLCFTLDALDHGRRIKVFLVVEHQSSRDAHMPWRGLVAAGETWGRYIRDHPRRRTIPFVLSLLLTQRPARSTPTRLSTIVDVSPCLRQLLGTPFEVDLRVDDFSGSLLRDRKSPVAIRALVELARALLHAYKNPASLTYPRLAELAPLVDLLLKHDRPDDVQALWVYVISVYEPGSRLRAMITKAVSQPAREMYMTIEEQLLARGRKLGEARGRKLGEARGRKLGEARGRKLGEARGRKLGEARGRKLGEARGRKLGEARGKAIGKAEALLGVLEQRGMPVSVGARRRILATDDERVLQQWLGRALTVETTAELFEPPPRGTAARSRVVARPVPTGARVERLDARG